MMELRFLRLEFFLMGIRLEDALLVVETVVLWEAADLIKKKRKILISVIYMAEFHQMINDTIAKTDSAI